MPLDDRERSFENAVAGHLRPAGSHGACSDAETLAAYHEQSLAPEVMVSLKSHISDCERCQQILAELQATDEIPLAADIAKPETAAAKSGVLVIPARKPILWGWGAPAGALAAGLLVWITLYESNSGRFAKAPSRGDAKSTEIATAQPSSASPQPAPSVDPTANSERLTGDALGRSDRVQPSLSKIAPGLQGHAQPLKKEKNSRNSGKPSSPIEGVAGGLAGAGAKLVTPPGSEPVLQATPPGNVTQTVTVEPVPAARAANRLDQAEVGKAESEAKSAKDKEDASRSRSSSPMPAPAPAPVPVLPQSSQSVEVTAESSAITTLPAHGRETAQLLLTSGGAPITVSAPDGRVSWRIGPAGVILFSSDAGKTWLVQPSGIIADLLAGSAPSAKVCWIVGRGGTILRTTDKGKHWKKVQPPTPDDFVSVFAVNARQATVSPASRTYQTTDGGATWNKLPPE